MSLQKFIRASAAQSALALPKSSFYAHIEEGLLPPPIRLGKRSVGWWDILSRGTGARRHWDTRIITDWDSSQKSNSYALGQ